MHDLCVNLPGRYRCECRPGYYGSGSMQKQAYCIGEKRNTVRTSGLYEHQVGKNIRSGRTSGLYEQQVCKNVRTTCI